MNPLTEEMLLVFLAVSRLGGAAQKADNEEVEDLCTVFCRALHRINPDIPALEELRK